MNRLFEPEFNAYRDIVCANRRTLYNVLGRTLNTRGGTLIGDYIMNFWTEYREDTCPLNDDNINSFNLMYYNSRANKALSPLADNLVDEYIKQTFNYPYTDFVPNNYFCRYVEENLADYYVCSYADYIARIDSMLKEKYNPIENYSSLEVTTYDTLDQIRYGKTDTLTMNNLKDENVSKTQTNLSQTNNSRNDNSNAGFKQVDSVTLRERQSDHSTQNIYGDADTNKTTTINTKSGSQKNTATGADENVKEGTVTVTKSGNIGVMTASQMIENELKLWGDPSRSLFSIMMKLLDDIVVSPLY